MVTENYHLQNICFSNMFRILEIFFFIWLAYTIMKNIGSWFSSSSSGRNQGTDFNSSQQQYKNTKEGEIHVEHVPDKKNPSGTHPTEDAEYIPFDEVKE